MRIFVLLVIVVMASCGRPSNNVRPDWQQQSIDRCIQLGGVPRVTGYGVFSKCAWAPVTENKTLIAEVEALKQEVERLTKLHPAGH